MFLVANLLPISFFVVFFDFLSFRHFAPENGGGVGWVGWADTPCTTNVYGPPCRVAFNFMFLWSQFIKYLKYSVKTQRSL